MNRPKAPIRILLVDDHAVVREGLRSFLESRPGLRVIGEAADGEQAVAMALASLPDIVMLDISMPVMSGIEAARRLRRLKPDLRLIMVSMNHYAAPILASFKAGAAGYILKDAAADEIVAAVEKVHAGGVYCSDAVFRGLVHDTIGAERLEAQLKLAEKLSPLERGVLGRLTEDVEAKVLSEQLNLPVEQIVKAIARIQETLKAGSHEDMRLLSLKLNLLDRGSPRARGCGASPT